MIAVFRRRLALAWFCLLLAALPRALLPAGLMPSFGGERIVLSYCVTDGSGRLLRQLGASAPAAQIDSGCAFALAHAAALPVAGVRGLAGRSAGVEVVPSAPTRPGHPQHPPRPPSQAPPVESAMSI